MSDKANYASAVRNAVAQLTVANPNRDGTGALVTLMAGGITGSRIDRVQFQATAVTTVGMLRLFRTKGMAGTPVATMTSSLTTVTVTTAVPHGRTNGEKVYVMDSFPGEYNVMGATLTVVTPTQFTYQVPTAPTTAAATTLGYYMTVGASPTSYLWREIPISAATPSASVPAWSNFAASVSDPGYLPLQLAYGWLLQASTEKAEVFNVIADYGNF